MQQCYGKPSPSVSDCHAQGWDPRNKLAEHRFLRVKGGFLQIRVLREAGRPAITFTHRNVDGHAVHEEQFTA